MNDKQQMASLSPLLPLLLESKQFHNLVEAVGLNTKIKCSVIEQARAYFVSTLFSEIKESILFLTDTDTKAKKYSEDIKLFTDSVKFLPKNDDVAHPDNVSSANKIEILKTIPNDKAIIICGLKTAMQKVPKLTDLPRTIDLLSGDNYDLNDLSKQLINMGYSREYLVEARGQFSIRGNIVDIYVPTAQYPYRLDFYGDRVEDIRSFDITTQKSIRKITSARIFPITPSFDLKPSTALTGYFNKNSIVILDERPILKQKSKDIYDEQDDGFMLSPQQFFGFSQGQIDLVSLVGDEIDFYFDFSPIKTIPGQYEKNRKILSNYVSAGDALVLCLEESGRQERMTEILKSWNIENAPLKYENTILPPSVWTATAPLSQGFCYETAKLCVLSDSDVFIRRFHHIPTTLRNTGEALTSFTDLNEGDNLVHIVHGIARYGGLVRQKTEGVEKEYLLLQYAAGDKLMVPVTQLDRVSKYMGTGKEPKITRLGTSAWPRTKRRVKESVHKLALELLDLYSDRAQSKGFIFSKDTVWQHELEEDFPFEETKGQISTIDSIKKDMESPKPMDRLVAGDVGFGKTEVALRAAFKSVMDSKQVILIAPTTVLTLQHFNTIKNRFSPFPVTVEMLSRFIKKSKQGEIIKEFNKGKIDILVGTHRLLQKDIIPKDLGLIVVDEEQRFGVKQKEKLRQIRKNVDVLTMTATPIPRTLQMAVSGIRDLSIIETPPENRLPISTHVGQYNEKTIIDAITKEINRGGQVFYLQNNIKTLPLIVEKLEKLIPQAKIRQAHGRLTERALEKTMIDFLDKKFDVLVTTTIIESGLDMPNVNTLIVTGAEDFGLSQLYQIRGRIGRSGIKAYAYLFYDKHLTEQAVERLKTLAQYTALGSGFKIAMKDLEIRGAGNLLGSEQSGHIDAVGFDLYIQLLKEAVAEIQGTEIKKPLEEREFKESAYLPSFYISDEALRIDFYHRIALSDDKESLGRITKELKDRFGKIPGPTLNLIKHKEKNL